MKVFISHKKEDSQVAVFIQNILKNLYVDAYLDVLEGNLLLKGEDLTNHIKDRLSDCTDLLVILSINTKESWWVPFEIGMAAQLDFPIVNYIPNFLSDKKVQLPEYLSYWPKLTKSDDLRKYVETRNTVSQQIVLENSLGKHSFFSKQSPTERFYKELKKIL